MPRPKTVLDPKTKAKAEEELQKLKNGKLAIQLKVIIASGDHSIESVSDIMKVSPRTLFRWINKFKERGIEGLKDQPKGHMKSKLAEEHRRRIEEWIMHGKNARGDAVHWTLKKLRLEINNEFGIRIGTTPLWKHLKKMGLVQKKPRPVHAKADPKAQEALKKTPLRRT